MSDPQSPAKVWYEANCHCGAVRLETQKVTNCNCSICCKNGYLNIYPKRADVVFHRGEDHIKGYRFGEKKCMHKFCPTCGSSLFVDPHMDDAELIVVNVCNLMNDDGTENMLIRNKVRMFKDIDVDKLELWKFDGYNRLEPRYKV